MLKRDIVKRTETVDTQGDSILVGQGEDLEVSVSETPEPVVITQPLDSGLVSHQLPGSSNPIGFNISNLLKNINTSAVLENQA